MTLTVERLQAMIASRDAAAKAGNSAEASSLRQEWERAIDASVVASVSTRGEIIEALELAAFLAASALVQNRIAACARLARAGIVGVELLVALRRAIVSSLPVQMAWGIAPDRGERLARDDEPPRRRLAQEVKQLTPARVGRSP